MKYTPFLVAMLALCACDKSATEHNFAPATSQSPAEQPSKPSTPENPHDLQTLASELSTSDPSVLPDVQPLTTTDGKIALDKTHILTDTPKADTATYDYPIALDSMAVKNYAKAYNITDKTSPTQHGHRHGKPRSAKQNPRPIKRRQIHRPSAHRWGRHDARHHDHP